jgi:hypothetical protein
VLRCLAVRDQQLLDDDRHHLSRVGAALVATAPAPRLE